MKTVSTVSTVAELDAEVAANNRRINTLRDRLFESRGKVSVENTEAPHDRLESEIRALDGKNILLQNQRPGLLANELRAQVEAAKKAVEEAAAPRQAALEKAQEAQRAAEQAGVEFYHANLAVEIAAETLRNFEAQVADSRQAPNPYESYFDGRGHLTPEGMRRALRSVTVDHEGVQLLAGFPVSFNGDGNAMMALQKHSFAGGDDSEIRAHLESQPDAQYRDKTSSPPYYYDTPTHLERMEATPGANC